ncbi:Ribonuclease HI [bioreactor metagenome]|uniref:ribonuclease H n=1 Tax=bioreactor metagenome TaxID=1076179 RepID=A0A644X1E0_9ZZZZ
MKKVMIYTDGACSGNPGPGGWGAVLLYNENRKEISGGETPSTNNRMEIMAAIAALESLKEACEVDLYSDSAYLVNAFKQEWLENWQRNGWKTSKKQPVENQDLWQRLSQQTKKHKVTWHKVKGHAENKENNRCDELARAAIANLGVLS